MKKETLLFCIILFLSIGCQQRKVYTSNIESDSTTVDITVNLENYQGVPYDSLIDDISFVRLETNDDCLIGAISQIICTDSLMFISDRDVSKSIYCFDRQGKFLRKLGAVGQGLGEYSGYYCYITLSPDKKNLIIMDWGKLIYFDFKGNLLKEITLDSSHAIRNLEFIDNNLMAGFEFYGNTSVKSKPMLSVYDTQLNLEHCAFPTISTDNFVLSPMNPLRKFDNEVYFNLPYSDTFYKVSSNHVSKAFHINFIKGGGAPPIEEGIDDRVYAEQLYKTIYCEDFIILKDVAVFQLSMPNGGYPIVAYSFKSKKTYYGNLNCHNPLFCLYKVPLTRDKENTLVTANSALSMLKLKQRLYESKAVNEEVLSQLYDGLTEESNPTIFFFHVNVD
ncbi:6-bladed beta-propeller [Bacteroides acidifaciens]|uniref:6-bladed beta-propeller n=1 Tax=Bacteroides acidifaciens TaxID=85831 RepID=UPI002557DFEF|nr:6-bladed beta-propeller [Bacteroides acidifaciens]